MKSLIGTLVFCGALSVLAGDAVAHVDLACTVEKCKFSEELGPSTTKKFQAYCQGEKGYDFTMVCHPVKGTTCTPAVSVTNYWSCTCTNWSATERKTVTIDILCKD